jgi:hypothetical protein
MSSRQRRSPTGRLLLLPMKQVGDTPLPADHNVLSVEAVNQRPTTCLHCEGRFRVVLPTRGDQESLAAIFARNRIEFMSALRESTGCGLVDAKAIAEHVVAKRGFCHCCGREGLSSLPSLEHSARATRAGRYLSSLWLCGSRRWVRLVRSLRRLRLGGRRCSACESNVRGRCEQTIPGGNAGGGYRPHPAKSGDPRRVPTGSPLAAPQ